MYIIKLTVLLVLLLSSKSYSIPKATYDDIYITCKGEEETKWYDKNGNFIESKYARAVDEYKFQFYSNYKKNSDKTHIIHLLNFINGAQRIQVIDNDLSMMKFIHNNIQLMDTYSDFSNQVFAFGTKHKDKTILNKVDNSISLITKNYKVSGEMVFHSGETARFRIIGRCENLEKLSQYANKYYNSDFNGKNNLSLKNILGKFLGK